VTADLPLWQATWAPDVEAVRAARVAVGAVLAGAGLEAALVSQALLVLSEIVGNAVRHARTDFTISVSVTGPAKAATAPEAAAAARTLRIEVFDLDTRPPAFMGIDPDSTGGRGLHIVAAIARDWGWQTAERGGGSGKVVWAELDVDTRR
jgi:anti-sigma regulatory factor (Ser/Thr protein kinase)